MKMNLWKKTKNKFSLNKIVHNILSINIISTHIFFYKTLQTYESILLHVFTTAFSYEGCD